jgi:hypothetical protein
LSIYQTISACAAATLADRTYQRHYTGISVLTLRFQLPLKGGRPLSARF